MSSARSSIVLTELQRQFEDPAVKERCLAVSREKILQFHMAARLFDTFPALLPEKMILGLMSEIQAILQLSNPSRAIETWLIKIAAIGSAEMLDEKGHVIPELASLLDWSADLSQERVYNVMVAFSGWVAQEILERLAKTLPQKIESPEDEKKCRKLQLFCLHVDKHNSQLIKEVLFTHEKIFKPDEMAKLDEKAKLKAPPSGGQLSERLELLLKDKRVRSFFFMTAIGMAGFAAYALVNHFMQPGEEKKEVVDESKSAPVSSSGVESSQSGSSLINPPFSKGEK